MPEIISRKEWTALGFTCRYGHIAPRTKKGTCVECKRIQNARRPALTEEQKVRAKEKQRVWAQKNPDKIRAARKRHDDEERRLRRLLKPPQPPLTRDEKKRRRGEQHFWWRMRNRDLLAAKSRNLRVREPDRVKRYAQNTYDHGRAAQLALRELGIFVNAARALRSVKMLGIQLGGRL